MMKFKEVVLSDASTEAKVAALGLLLDKELLKLADLVFNVKKLEGPKGEEGIQGAKGDQGDRGFDGTNGTNGRDGVDGLKGDDGSDGVGVADARIDFDGSLVIVLTNGKEINAGDVVPLNVTEKLKIVKSTSGTANSVLEAIEAINTAIASYGTMATQNANAVAITGGTINGATVGATTPAAGTFTTLSTGALTATSQTSLGGAAGSEGLRVLTPVAAAGLRLQVGVPNSSVVRLGPAGTAVADFRILTPTFTNFYTGSSSDGLTDGAAQMRVAHTASAVNYVQVTGNITNNAPSVISAGSDSAVGLALSSKGTGTVSIFSNSVNSNSRHLDITHNGSVVNRFQLTGANTGSGVVLGVNGTDTNISQVFQSKGTGAIDLAAGSSGVNISNGGTVTAITRTATGSGYTTIPSVAVSAPTTAGGVQAVVTVAQMQIAGAGIQSGGTGYTVGDTLTIVGGTPVTSAATVIVATVSAGVITSINIGAFTNYTVLPTNPVSVTGGTGSGATFNITYAVISFTIGTAGSGYVEQPTVTFSGGGGSGATAYATVGSGTTVESLGSTMSFYTSAGESFRVAQSSTYGTGYFSVVGSAITPSLISSSSNAIFGNSGAGVLQFITNNASEQFRVSHTASAVNYVQVTGAATGNPGVCLISAQGSDANISLAFVNKGTGAFSWFNGATTGSRLFRVNGNTTNMANYLQVDASAASFSPVLSALGSDTNIDLTLTPKGTGNVRFGTLTASADAPITGYITIKDSGGTVRKLAVIA
jgi:hypothetical protein